MAEASDLRKDVTALEDEDLQKRFAALFDDGQGENARRAFVNYCRNQSYHPSEMYILCGSNMFRRLRDMVKRQEGLLEEYRLANKYLLEAARRLNGGKLVLPPKETMQRAAKFQGLIRQKFGDTQQARSLACNALGITKQEFNKLAAGTDLTDGFIGYLEELSDYVPAPRGKAKNNPKPVVTKRYREIERIMADVPKPKKHSRAKADMTRDELTGIGELLFGLDWLLQVAKLTGYSKWNFQQFLKGGDTRRITEEAALYLRRADQRFRNSGASFGPSLPSKASR
jgi:hypothetical protein